jgi:GDP-L-fucose synthase
MKKRIILTGSNGMVGRNILNHKMSKKWIFFSPSREELDLQNFGEVQSYIDDKKPDLIIHAAGHVGGIHANINNPVNFLVSNIDIGRNVVLAAHHSGVKKLINLGSSCMYPRNAINPLKEEVLLHGELEPTNEGYALAKIIVTKLCEYINREDSNFQYKTMIPCNIYGRFDKFDEKKSHLIPAIITKLQYAIDNNIDEVEIWGNGLARREFMFADDLADAIIYALDKFDSMPSIINIGMGNDFLINEYYSTIAKIMNYKGLFKHNLNKPVGMQQKLVSIEKQIKWGWSSKTSLEDGVKDTYKYYLNEVNYGR